MAAYVIEWLPGVLVIWFWWRSRRMEAQIMELYALMSQLKTTRTLHEFDAILTLVSRYIEER